MTQTLLAYLDPGSGSMILQVIAGGAAAVGVGVTMWWRRLRRFLRIEKRDKDAAAPDSTR